MKKLGILLLLTVFAVMTLSGCGGQDAAPQDAIVMDPDKPAEAPAVTEAPAPTDAPAAPDFAPTDEPAVPKEPDAPQQLSVDALYALLEQSGSLENMARYSDTDLLDLYGIDVAACKSAAGYINASGLCDQVVLAVANDADTASQIHDLLAAHVERLLTQYNGYDADAYATVQKAELYQDGNAVVLLISPDAASLLEICRGFTF